MGGRCLCGVIFAFVRLFVAVFLGTLPVGTRLAAAVFVSVALAALVSAVRWPVFRSFAEFFGYVVAAHFDFEEFFNFGPSALVALTDECYGFAVGIGACRAADAVHVVFGFVRHVVCRARECRWL